MAIRIGTRQRRAEVYTVSFSLKPGYQASRMVPFNGAHDCRTRSDQTFVALKVDGSVASALSEAQRELLMATRVELRPRGKKESGVAYASYAHLITPEDAGVARYVVSIHEILAKATDSKDRLLGELARRLGHVPVPPLGQRLVIPVLVKHRGMLEVQVTVDPRSHFLDPVEPLEWALYVSGIESADVLPT